MGTRIGTRLRTISPPSDVLLVEQDESLGQAVVEILRSNGYEATLALSAAEAHQRLEQSTPCVILIGSLAPTEARALVRVLRNHHRRTPAIILASEEKVRGPGPVTEGWSAAGSIAPLLRDPSDLIRIVERYCSPDKTFATAARGHRIN